MAYVTEDKRVQAILTQVQTKMISREWAATKIRNLPPQENARISYLDWEVQEALNSL